MRRSPSTRTFFPSIRRHLDLSPSSRTHAAVRTSISCKPSSRGASRRWIVSSSPSRRRHSTGHSQSIRATPSHSADYSRPPIRRNSRTSHACEQKPRTPSARSAGRPPLTPTRAFWTWMPTSSSPAQASREPLSRPAPLPHWRRYLPNRTASRPTGVTARHNASLTEPACWIRADQHLPPVSKRLPACWKYTRRPSRYCCVPIMPRI